MAGICVFPLETRGRSFLPSGLASVVRLVCASFLMFTLAPATVLLSVLLEFLLITCCVFWNAPSHFLICSSKFPLSFSILYSGGMPRCCHLVIPGIFNLTVVLDNLCDFEEGFLLILISSLLWCLSGLMLGLPQVAGGPWLFAHLVEGLVLSCDMTVRWDRSPNKASHYQTPRKAGEVG